MDFMGLLREHAGTASRDERLALYQSLRGRVDRFAASAEGDGERLKARAYRDALEVAIEAFERERDDVAPVVSARAWKPPVERAGTAAEPAPAPAPASTDAAPAGRGGALRLVMVGLLGIGLGAGMLAVYQAVTRSPAEALVERYASGQAASQAHVEMVRTFRTAVEEHRRTAGGYPTTGDAWTTFAAAAEPIPALKALLDRATGPKDRLLYRGSSTDFKLIMHNTGDCFVVRLDKPALVDPVRSAGEVDCYAYGFWTSGAAVW